ncbi:MAG: flagellar brake protein [Burkholderiales bacterium]|nr:flagellar brake protein [Burkholderiales bacterium]
MSARTDIRPESDGQANDDYRLRAAIEVENILKDIAARRLLVTLYFGADRFIVSTLLAADSRSGVVLDAAQDDATTQAIAASPTVIAITFVDQIKTQFALRQLRVSMHTGRPALSGPLPQSILRLQRRESFRVAPPKAAGLSICVPLPGREPATFSLGDLSVGGVAVLTGPPVREFVSGAVFDDCSLMLPEYGAIKVSLEIRNHRPAGGERGLRYGCRFHNLAGTVASLIQRSINDLQKNARTAAR